MRVLTTAQMRDADAAAVARDGDVGLMQAAGDAIAEAIVRIAPRPRRLVAFAGPGNNGGDAFAAFAAGTLPCERVVYALPAGVQSAGRLDAVRRARAAGTIVRPVPLSLDDALASLAGADVVLDALLGTGARADAPREMAHLIEAMNRTTSHVLAVDVPTGIDATTGAVGRDAVRADTTVSLGALKIGLLLDPARAHVGTLYVADIGIDPDVAALGTPRYAALDDREFRALLPSRAQESDKRRAGAPLVIAGSSRYPGAAILCARGAARAGAGYVTVATPQEAVATLHAHLIEQVVVAFEARNVGETIDALLEACTRSNAVGIGPGLSVDQFSREIVCGFLERVELPCVIDASALTLLADDLDLIRGKMVVLTPHESEFARISGEGPIAPGTRIERLRSFAARTGITTLLKGNATLVDDGETTHLNVTGSNALATAGTGDVLTGIIATLLSQGLGPADAARAGAYWHGLAGRVAALARPVGVIASDVATALGAAIPAEQSTASEGRLTRVASPATTF